MFSIRRAVYNSRLPSTCGVWFGTASFCTAVLNCDALLRCSAAALGAAKKFPVVVVVVYARVERALFGLCACGAAGGCGFDAGGFGCDGLPWKLESKA